MDTKVKPVEVLLLVKYYMEQLGLTRLFDKFVPNRNGAEIAPAQVLCLLVMNIMVSAKPPYRVEDWLHDYLDGMAEERVEAAKYNDDRLGRNLDLLFAADRASFLTELSAKAMVLHQLETETIHNDSTSVTFLGAYDADDPKAVKTSSGSTGTKSPTVASKDGCKRIVSMWASSWMKARGSCGCTARPKHGWSKTTAKNPTWRTIMDSLRGVHLTIRFWQWFAQARGM